MPNSSSSSNTTCRASCRPRWRGSRNASPADTALRDAFARQIVWCREPSPFTARLLARGERWLAADAEAHAELSALTAEPLAGLVALRWAAALHRLALQGIDPWAALWPPAACSDAELDAAIDLAWRTQRASLREMLASPPQTNEVQRSAALLPGLLHVAARTGLPLALLEIGSSAGLNLWPDRHRYDFGSWQWGTADAPLQLRAAWTGAVPPAVPLQVAARAGSDLQPIDVTDTADATRLRSYVWADQRDRLARLDTAIAAVAGWMRDAGVTIDRRSALGSAESHLSLPRDGITTVLLHSIVWQYVDAGERSALEAVIGAAGARATPAAPFAWLRLELPAADNVLPELRCRIWPGGADTLLARAHPHGASIDWLA